MDQAAVLKIARAYADAVRKVMPTNGIFLYGSHVKGTANRDSDIDIAVVVDDVPGDYLSTVAMLWKMTRSIGQEIEPVLLTKADTDSGFLGTVQKTGIAI